MRLNLNSMWATEDRNGNIAEKSAKLEKTIGTPECKIVNPFIKQIDDSRAAPAKL